MNSSLTQHERERLAVLETEIQGHLHGFVRAGRALLEVREKKLFRSRYATFEDYCLRKWDLGRTHAWRLIAASEVADNLQPEKGKMFPVGNISDPVSERQVRPIVEAKLEPKQQLEAWEAAHEIASGPPTGKDVEAAVANIEALSADEQLEAVGRAQADIRRSASIKGKLDAHGKRLHLARRHSQRLRKTLEGLGGEADRALALVDQLDEELGVLEAT